MYFTSVIVTSIIDQSKRVRYLQLLTFTFTIIQAFPLYKAYMLGFGQVRKGS